MRDEPFVGWRVWRVFDWQKGILGAAAMPFAWEGCRLSIPAAEIQSLPVGGGFHAFKELMDMLAYTVIISSPLPIVYGKVRLFGVVVEYERGFRASDAIIDRLYIAPEWDGPFRQRLADRYQCDVTPWDGLAPPPNQHQALWWAPQLQAQSQYYNPLAVGTVVPCAAPRRKRWYFLF